jgi:type IV pilus biogenesis/stability protein PilW
MKALVFTISILSMHLLSACGPMSAITIAGSAFNRIMEYSDTQPLLSDTGPSYSPNPADIAIANLNLGIEYMRLGKYEMSLYRLQRARMAKPEFAPIYDVLGLLHQRLGKPEEAEKYFLHAIKLDENNSPARNNYGQFLCSRERVEEAEKYFLAAAENPLYDSREIPYANIGTCAYLHNDTAKATEYYKKALSINSKIPAALINMSTISYDNRAYADAHDYLGRYLQNAAHTPKSLWLGIRIEHELGDKNAVASYALLLRNKYPDSNEAKLLNESDIR